MKSNLIGFLWRISMIFPGFSQLISYLYIGTSLISMKKIDKPTLISLKSLDYLKRFFLMNEFIRKKDLCNEQEILFPTPCFNQILPTPCFKQGN